MDFFFNLVEKNHGHHYGIDFSLGNLNFMTNNKRNAETNILFILDVIVIQDKVKLFITIHYGWKIGETCSKLGLNGQILINSA